MSLTANIDVRDKVVSESGLNPDWLLASRQDGIKELRVLDVGQGDAVAVYDNNINMKIIMYVDYGGCAYHPDKGSAYLDTPSRLSISDRPVVVLTHWDKDHYYSATKVPNVEHCKWVVPRQRVGPQAAQFAAKLTNAHLWPESIGTSPISFDSGDGCKVEIQKCGAFPLTGAENRHLTGLAVTIFKDENGTRKAIVLVGDAPFDKVPTLANWQGTATVVGLIAYHHGGDDHWTNLTTSTLSKIAPVAAGSPGPDLVYSYGVDQNRCNQYGHPKKPKYSQGGLNWKTHCETPTAPIGSNGFKFCTLSLC